MDHFAKNFEKLLLTHSGHDKALRAIQYSMRIWLALTKNYQTNLGKERANSLIETFNLVKRSMSAARRCCRFGKQLSVLQTVYRLIAGFKQAKTRKFNKFGNIYYVIFRCVNNLLASVFFSLDHIFWAYLVGLHKNRDLVGRVGIISDYVWISSSICSIIYSCVEMSLIQQETNTKIESKSDKNGLEVSLGKSDRKIDDLALDIVKHICDICVNFF